MFKKILYPVLTAAVLFPATAFAQEAGDTGGFATYIQEHWHDIPTLLLLIIAAIFAFRTSFLYGGIIGKALNLVSIGMLFEAISDIVGNFLLHMMEAEGTNFHYVVDFLQVVGVMIIVFAFWRMHAQTTQQFAVKK